jgi:hypothetical protein
MEMLPPTQEGVGGDDGGNFPDVAATDQPFRRWEKGSTAAASKNYGKTRASLFYRNEGVHKKTETRQRSRGNQVLVARSAWWAAPPMLV